MTDVRQPHNPSELRRALRIGRANINRTVEIWDSKAVYSNRPGANHHFDIDVHPESQLTLMVRVGLPFLKVVRGSSESVTVIFTSIWGNSLEIMPHQGAAVSVPWPDTKVTLTGDGGDLNLSAPEGKNRVRIYTRVGG